MIREPWFWRSNTLAARIIAHGVSPLSAAYDLAQRARWTLNAPASIPVPTICIGNATLGGVGKTPCAIALQKLLAKAGVNGQVVTRGYGGAWAGPLKVDAETHNAGDVGDEALLLARRAITWVSRNRTAGAQAAAQDGADVVILDDGFQNPTIAKTVSILMIDADDPAGNGKVFPAGPMREPLKRAKARADVTIYVGPSEDAARRAAKENNSPHAAWLAPVGAPAPRRVIAFCGIGRPQKFFDSLSAAGFDVAQTVGFSDHHAFTEHELSALNRLSAEKSAALITTEKDHVRLPMRFADDILTFPVEMLFHQPALLTDAVLSAIRPHMRAE